MRPGHYAHKYLNCSVLFAQKFHRLKKKELYIFITVHRKIIHFLNVKTKLNLVLKNKT